jgi:hypothetical protein
MTPQDFAAELNSAVPDSAALTSRSVTGRHNVATLYPAALHDPAEHNMTPPSGITST